MNITKDQIKETLKTVMAEEADYKSFFKKALEKAGKSIPSMSDEEKKEFFNKIDTAWDSKGEKNEGNAFGAAVTKAKEAGEDEFEVDGKKFKVQESHSDCGCGCGGVTEGGCNTKSVNEATDIYQLKKIQITKFAGKGGQMIQINAPKYQTAGDHIVMTKKEFMHVLKMAPLLLKQLKESVNEAASKEAMGIAALTGTRGSAVEEFINKHELDGGKLFRSIKKANLRGRLNFVSALAGKDGNPNQKLTIKLHKKKFNEELSKELAFEVISFIDRPVIESKLIGESNTMDVINVLINEGIKNVLTDNVKAEFDTLVTMYNK